MNTAPFEAARKTDIRNTLLISAIVLLLGFAAMLALFWAQSYRASRRQLLDARAFSDEVVEHIPVGIVVTGHDERVILVNDPAEALLGISRQLITGKPAADVLPDTLLELTAHGQPGRPVLERECFVRPRSRQSCSAIHQCCSGGNRRGTLCGKSLHAAGPA